MSLADVTSKVPVLCTMRLAAVGVFDDPPENERDG